MPMAWCLEKVATLLMMSGTEVTHAVLGNRAVNGQVEELSVMAYYLAQVCVKEDKLHGTSNYLRYVMRERERERERTDRLSVFLVSTSWYVEILRYVVSLIPNKSDRRSFSSSLMSSWQEYLTALFEDGNTSDDSGW